MKGDSFLLLQVVYYFFKTINLTLKKVTWHSETFPTGRDYPPNAEQIVFLHGLSQTSLWWHDVCWTWWICLASHSLNFAQLWLWQAGKQNQKVQPEPDRESVTMATRTCTIRWMIMPQKALSYHETSNFSTASLRSRMTSSLVHGE